MSVGSPDPGSAPEADNGMFQYVFQMIQGNGLSTLVERFQAEGLGEVVNSWIGTGENKTISVEQLQKILSPEHISDMASKLGISKEHVMAQLSKVLPALVDKLTPNGKLPDTATIEKGLGMLKGMLSGFLGGDPQTPPASGA